MTYGDSIEQYTLIVFARLGLQLELWLVLGSSFSVRVSRVRVSNSRRTTTSAVVPSAPQLRLLKLRPILGNIIETQTTVKMVR